MRKDVKKDKNFTGIGSVRLQDDAVITSMGAVLDRTIEHLGTADAALIRVRRRLLEAARAFRDRGVAPPASRTPSLYRVRSCQAILGPDQDWRTALDDWQHCRTPEHPTGGFHPVRAYAEGGRGNRTARPSS